MRVCESMCVCESVRVCARESVRVCVCVRERESVCVRVYIFLHMFACMRLLREHLEREREY